MSTFLIIAAALALAACALLLLPLLRRGSSTPAARMAAAVVAVLVLGGSAVLYANFSSWSWKSAAGDATPEGMVGRLARRLDRNPEDLQGWLLLGRSYSQLEQYPNAVRAYQRADRLAGGQNAEALTGLAEALVLANQSDLAGRAGRLFEQALVLDPRSTKALFYSAIAAMERGEKPLARTRFSTLLAAEPPPEVRRLIEQTLQNLEAASPDGTAKPADAPQHASASPEPQAAGAAVPVRLQVTLAPSVAGRSTDGAPLFVLARKPGQKGPPIAAKRLDARFPQQVVLLSSDAMLGGSGFAAGDELEITARISNGGSALPKSGDPFGTIRVKAGAAAPAALVIDQVTP
jgi:cytochrome c-type biogenesis protein CcmH